MLHEHHHKFPTLTGNTRSHSLPEKAMIFPTPKNNVGNTMLSSSANTLLNAMNNYDNIQATIPQRVLIAKELDNACREFGVDSKMMLAVFAHESGGIDPSAESNTGAKGLGQLTGIAIDECIRLAKTGCGDNYERNLSKFKTAKANIWTSVAYMDVALSRKDTLKGALKYYGDPHVRTYANKVANEYRELWGNNLHL